MSVNKPKPWTRNELILAINLYCKTPFGRIHVRNPDIIALADKLECTPGSIGYKLANFASLDNSLPRKVLQTLVSWTRRFGTNSSKTGTVWLTKVKSAFQSYWINQSNNGRILICCLRGSRGKPWLGQGSTSAFSER